MFPVEEQKEWGMGGGRVMTHIVLDIIHSQVEALNYTDCNTQ